MNSEFLPEADKEFREAVRYYENEAPGVGITGGTGSDHTNLLKSYGLICNNGLFTAL